MPPFQFRLETLLKYRRIVEDQAQIQLAQATSDYLAAKDLLCALQQQLDTHIALCRDMRQEPTTVATLKMLQEYHDKMIGDVDQQTIRVCTADGRRKECMAVLETAAQSRKLVEKLRDKRLQQHQLAELASEQKLLDEMGIQVYARNS
jgi:flagellar protein FliJ